MVRVKKHPPSLPAYPGDPPQVVHPQVQFILEVMLTGRVFGVARDGVAIQKVAHVYHEIRSDIPNDGLDDGDSFGILKGVVGISVQNCVFKLLDETLRDDQKSP